MKKTLSLFTKTLMGLVNHKAKNGYPEGPIHEGRRMPKHELEKMEYYTYDSEGNNYEIYRKVFPEGRGNRWETVKYYNYRGREVREVWPKQERVKKPKKGAEEEPTIAYPHAMRSKWIQVESYWDRNDIEEYVDLLTDEQIKNTKYWFGGIPVDNVDVPAVVAGIIIKINQLIDFNGKFYNRSDEVESARTAAQEMKVIFEELQALLPQVDEKDAKAVQEILRRLDIRWVHVLSDQMSYAEIYRPIVDLSYSEVLKLKEIRFEYKKRLTLQKASDDESIARHMGIEEIVIK